MWQKYFYQASAALPVGIMGSVHVTSQHFKTYNFMAVTMKTRAAQYIEIVLLSWYEQTWYLDHKSLTFFIIFLLFLLERKHQINDYCLKYAALEVFLLIFWYSYFKEHVCPYLLAVKGVSIGKWEIYFKNSAALNGNC